MSRNNIMKQINALQKSIDSLEKGHKQGHFDPRTKRTPDRLKDTEADRNRPISEPKKVPETPPYDPFGDIGKAEGDTAPATQSTRAFADSAARRNKASEERRIKEIPPQPVTTTRPSDDYPVDDETTVRVPTGRMSERADDDIDDDPTRHKAYSMDKDVKRKPPYKMEYLDEVELDLKGNEISMDKEDNGYRHMGDRIPKHVKSQERAKAEMGRGDVKRVGPERVRVPNRPEAKPEQNFDMMRKAIENSLLKLMQYGGV